MWWRAATTRYIFWVPMAARTCWPIRTIPLNGSLDGRETYKNIKLKSLNPKQMNPVNANVPASVLTFFPQYTDCEMKPSLGRNQWRIPVYRKYSLCSTTRPGLKKYLALWVSWPLQEILRDFCLPNDSNQPRLQTTSVWVNQGWYLSWSWLV